MGKARRWTINHSRCGSGAVQGPDTGGEWVVVAPVGEIVDELRAIGDRTGEVWPYRAADAIEGWYSE